MAEARVSENLDELNCPICCNLLKDPVSIPCGHSFCMTCINARWDEEFRGFYICPTCEQCFIPRPVLKHNMMLVEMMKILKKTDVPEKKPTRPEHVECDICVGQKYTALKSCLDCVASYCEVHLKLHNEWNPGNMHKVIETRYNLKDRICRTHNKLQDVLCCTEDRAVCSQCAVSLCRGHNTIPFAKKRVKQQIAVQMIRSQVLGKAEEALSSMADLRKAIQSIKFSAQTLLDQSEKLLVELISSAERKRLEIRGIIQATEEAEVQRAQEVLECMEEDVTKLKETDNKLLQLEKLDDDYIFLVHCMSLSDFATFDGVAHVSINPSPFKEIQNSVSELEIKVKEFYKTGSEEFVSVNGSQMVLTSVPIIREDFIQYFHQLSVDPSTASSDFPIKTEK